MTQNSPDPTPPKAGTLQSMVARLRGMFHSLKNTEAEPAPASGDAEVLPTFDTPLAGAAGPAEPAESAPASPPMAVPIPAPESIPVAVPLTDGAAPPLAEPVVPAEPAAPAEPAEAAE